MNYAPTNKELKKISPILTKLSQRKHNEMDEMYTDVGIASWYCAVADGVYCALCKKELDLPYHWADDLKIQTRVHSILNHGIDHLKEYNLLPFI